MKIFSINPLKIFKRQPICKSSFEIKMEDLVRKSEEAGLISFQENIAKDVMSKLNVQQAKNTYKM